MASNPATPVTPIQPLSQRNPIVDPETGKASDYFMRYIANHGGQITTNTSDITTVEQEVAVLEAATIQGTAGEILITPTSGLIIDNPTLSLANTSVTPGSYTNSNITVDQFGRVTSAANGSSSTGTVTSVGGTGTVSGITLSGTVTTSGNLTLGGTLLVSPSNFAAVNANQVLAGPASGVASTPTFRSLVAADIPVVLTVSDGTHSESAVSNLVFSAAVVSTTGTGEATVTIPGTLNFAGTIPVPHRYWKIGLASSGNNYTDAAEVALYLNGVSMTRSFTATGSWPSQWYDNNVATASTPGTFGNQIFEEFDFGTPQSFNQLGIYTDAPGFLDDACPNIITVEYSDDNTTWTTVSTTQTVGWGTDVWAMFTLGVSTESYLYEIPLLQSPVGQGGCVLSLNSAATGFVFTVGGTVTSVTAGTGLSGGTITGSGTIALANTTVTAGSYTNANITVNAQGQITAASNGSGGSGGSLTVTDGTHTETSVTTLTFSGAVVSTTGAGNATVTVSGGGGSGGGALSFIGKVVSVGGETSLQVTGIPSTFKDLVVAFNLQASINTFGTLTFNNDTSSSYDMYRSYGGYAAGSNQELNTSGITDIIGAAVGSGYFLPSELILENYAASINYKAFVGQSLFQQSTSVDDGYIVNFAGKWKNLSAISSIKITLPSGTFEAGSEIVVYGRAESASSGGSYSQSQKGSFTSVSSFTLTGLDFLNNNYDLEIYVNSGTSGTLWLQVGDTTLPTPNWNTNSWYNSGNLATGSLGLKIGYRGDGSCIVSSSRLRCGLDGGQSQMMVSVSAGFWELTGTGDTHSISTGPVGSLLITADWGAMTGTYTLYAIKKT